MTRSSIHTVFANSTCYAALLALWLFAPGQATAQQAERVLAPGVLTTIAPVIEEGETYSTPADLIEILSLIHI